MKIPFFSIIIVLAIMLIAGCVQSDEPEYQDAQWNTSFHNTLALIHSDLNASIAATDMTNSLTDPSYTTAAQNLIKDSKAAINENNNFTVSPKLQEAQKEWGLGLNDSISVGVCMLNVSEATKNKNEALAMEEAEKLCSFGSSMSTHMNRADTLSKIALGTP